MVQQQTAVRYASWSRRVGASLIDNLITAAPLALGGLWIYLNRWNGQITDAEIVFLILLVLLSIGLGVYNRWVRSGRTGRSWGRQKLGIRLVGDATGGPIGGGRAFVRDLAHVVDSLVCNLGYLFPLWDPKRQTLADKMTGTVVIED
jgi:uncharacterized RDD family membrane protein YckC